MKNESEPDIAPEEGCEPCVVCCISCGATSPTLSTDVGIRMWVSVHPCGVPTDERQWFTSPVGEEDGD